MFLAYLGHVPLGGVAACQQCGVEREKQERQVHADFRSDGFHDVLLSFL